MPENEAVPLVSIHVRVLPGGGFYLEWFYKDHVGSETAVESPVKMKKRLKLLVDEMLEDNKPKGK